MASGTSFLPDTDGALLAWSLNFSTRITSTPTAFGLTSGLASSYATLHGNFSSAMAAIDPGERSKSLTAAKNSARTALKDNAGLLAKLVEGTSTVTDSQKIDLGINVRAVPTPILRPAAAPVVGIVATVARRVTIKLNDVTSDRRGRPLGVQGASVFSHIGPTAPVISSDWQFQGNTSKTVVDVNFDESVASGATVWITAVWYNPRSESGPQATPISTNLPGGSAMAA